MNTKSNFKLAARTLVYGSLAIGIILAITVTDWSSLFWNVKSYQEKMVRDFNESRNWKRYLAANRQKIKEEEVARLQTEKEEKHKLDLERERIEKEFQSPLVYKPGLIEELVDENLYKHPGFEYISGSDYKSGDKVVFREGVAENGGKVFGIVRTGGNYRRLDQIAPFNGETILYHSGNLTAVLKVKFFDQPNEGDIASACEDSKGIMTLKDGEREETIEVQGEICG